MVDGPFGDANNGDGVVHNITVSREMVLIYVFRKTVMK